MSGEKLIKLEIYLTAEEALEMARNTNKVVRGQPLEYRKAREILMSVNIGLRQQGVTAQ